VAPLATSATASRSAACSAQACRPLSRRLALLFALTSGLAIANLFYAQPLLDAIAASFDIGHDVVGTVVTVTMVGYGFGLLFVVPLGDRVDRRRLVLTLLLFSVAALIVVATTSTHWLFMIGVGTVGATAVVAQVLVASASVLARPAERGRMVGVVTSGIVIGVLLVLTASGTMSDLFGWRSIYVFSAGATLLVAALMARALPASVARAAPMSYARLIRSVFALFAELPVLRVRAALALLGFAAKTMLLTPIVLPLSAPPWSLSHTQVGLFGLAGIVGVAGAAGAGRLADRGRAQWATGTALTGMLLSWALVATLPHSLWGLVVGVAVLEFSLQRLHVCNQSLIYRERPDAQSRLAAGYMIFYAIGSAAASAASTLVYARFGWSGVCLVGAGISAMALAFWAATMPPTAATARRTT
jgi:predicted MFS family arabinose efflux permease